MNNPLVAYPSVTFCLWDDAYIFGKSADVPNYGVPPLQQRIRRVGYHEYKTNGNT